MNNNNNAPIQKVEPIKTYTQPLPEVERVKPSITEKLKPGQVLDVLPVQPAGEFFIQRLTDRTYYVLANVYSLTVYVGDTGILLIDSPDTIPTEPLLAEIKKLTPLPVKALAYSHPHIDHIGGAERLKNALQQQGIELRIIGSANCAKEIERYKYSMFMPTEVIPNGRQTFEFDGQTFKFVTPGNWAHCGADSYIIPPDGVIQFVDYVYPAQLPMCDCSGAQNMTGYIEFLRYVAGEPDWQFANLGHANVGSRTDVERTLEYFKDLYTAMIGMWKGFDPVWLQQFKHDITGVFIRNIFDAGAEQLTMQVQEKWSRFPHWEVSRDHAEKVMWDVVLNYDHKRKIIPDFDPIPAP